MKICGLFLGISIFLFSCQNKPFEREKELFDYLSKVQNIDLLEKKNIVILQANFCGACTWEVVSFLKEELPQTAIPTYIIFSGSQAEIEKQLGQIESKYVHIVISEENMVGRYGLQYTKDLYFNIEKKKINTWGFLKSEELDKIRKSL